MNINQWERKYGRFAIPNLTLIIIGTYIIGYGLTFVSPNVMGYLTLDPYQIIYHFQIWRIVSWLLIPPGQLGIFTIIMLLLYFSLGRTLEHSWGDFRYNLYIFSGIFFTIIGAFLLYLVGSLTGWFDFSTLTPEVASAYMSMGFSTYYINLSIFFAFAASYPDMQLLLYFIIPVKIKWLAILDAVFILVDFFTLRAAGKMTIIVSLLNFLIFFLSTRNLKRISPREVHRKQEFRRATRPEGMGTVTKHKCAVCGRTELDGDDLEFRFCSKCEGNYEYCQYHLFSHEHVKK